MQKKEYMKIRKSLQNTTARVGECLMVTSCTLYYSGILLTKGSDLQTSQTLEMRDYIVH